MSKIVTVPIQLMRAILDCVGNASPVVFWMRSTDYQKQIYVSESFDQIWGVSSQELYKKPQTFNEFILKDDFSAFSQITSIRKSRPDEVQDKPNEFRIITADGHIKLLRDRSFPIYDNNGNQIAIAGICEDRTDLQNKTLTPHLDLATSSERLIELQTEIGNALEAELKLHLDNTHKRAPPIQKTAQPGVPYLIDGYNVILTKREAECLNKTLAGYSNKVVGNMLCLSPRTVEAYLDQIKDKVGCRTKLELITKFILAL